MKRRLLIGAAFILLVSAAMAAGCGGNGASQVTTPTTTPSSGSQGSAGSSSSASSESPDALTAEAQSAAAGDIPDNQVFLVFRNSAEGYSMKYPEGWAQRGRDASVSFRDKNNLVRVTVAKGEAPSVSGVSSDLNQLKQATPSLSFEAPEQVSAGGKTLVKVVYTTESAPNPVTGKRVTLVVDRYYVPGRGKYAVVDLGTPQGVDNVDAYRLMIESFQWT